MAYGKGGEGRGGGGAAVGVLREAARRSGRTAVEFTPSRRRVGVRR